MLERCTGCGRITDPRMYFVGIHPDGCGDPKTRTHDGRIPSIKAPKLVERRSHARPVPTPERQEVA